MKLRDEYPFLREESTPQELKALVTDKITAWYDFAEKHEKLAKMVENSGNTISENGEPDPLAVLCKEAIDKFQLNADIKKEKLSTAKNV